MRRSNVSQAASRPMTRSLRVIKLTASLLLAALCLVPSWGSLVRAQQVTPAEPAPAAEPVQVPASKNDLTARSQEALSSLDALTARLEATGDAAEAGADVEALQAKLDALLPEGRNVEDLLGDPSVVDGVALRSRALTNQANALIETLAEAADSLEQLRGEARGVLERWQRIKGESEDLPEALLVRVNGILERAAQVEGTASGKLNRVIELQDVALAVRNRSTPIAERIDSYGRSQQVRLFEQNAEPIWAMTSEHLSASSQRSLRQFAQNARKDFLTWRDTAEAALGGHLLLLPLLIFLLFRLRSATEAPGAALARPVPTALLIWMLIGVAIYAGAPQAVRMVYMMTAVVTSAVVLLNFLPQQLRLGVLLFVSVALVHEAFQTLPIVEHLPRVAYLLFSLMLAVLAWFGRREAIMGVFIDWGAPRAFIVTVTNAALVILLIAVAANVLGYVVLAKHLTVGAIDSTAVFLVLFAGFSSISEIIQMVLSLPALDNFRSIAANRYRLNRVLKKPLVWLSLILWSWASLVAFDVDTWVLGSLQSVFQAEITIGEATLSLRGVLVFVFAVWVAVWASRIVRAVLNQDVLPRLDLPRGVPNTISMTAHYSIILMGLLMGVSFIGLDLSNLAIVVGALGIGIGFGLQNLVNNFVSGLILIFEAPIQVGDTVEVGNLMGRVIQIGIRTSRVRTFAGSEVIVPNGDLVSNQVINWTLTDRRRRLELRVGVAYGSDPEQVTRILQGVVAADEGVLDDPAPMIVFREFGDSSLNFDIRAWIADFDTGLMMTHRLNTAVYAALEEAGISIPFPQRDLHLKSLPEDFKPRQAGADPV